MKKKSSLGREILCMLLTAALFYLLIFCNVSAMW